MKSQMIQTHRRIRISNTKKNSTIRKFHRVLTIQSVTSWHRWRIQTFIPAKYTIRTPFIRWIRRPVQIKHTITKKRWTKRKIIFMARPKHRYQSIRSHRCMSTMKRMTLATCFHRRQMAFCLRLCHRINRARIKHTCTKRKQPTQRTQFMRRRPNLSQTNTINIRQHQLQTHIVGQSNGSHCWLRSQLRTFKQHMWMDRQRIWINCWPLLKRYDFVWFVLVFAFCPNHKRSSVLEYEGKPIWIWTFRFSWKKIATDFILIWTFYFEP